MLFERLKGLTKREREREVMRQLDKGLQLYTYRSFLARKAEEDIWPIPLRHLSEHIEQLGRVSGLQRQTKGIKHNAQLAP